MTSIHDRGRQLAAQKQIPLSDAYAELARRSAVKRRRFKPPLGVLQITNADRQAFANVESPRYWYHDRD